MTTRGNRHERRGAVELGTLLVIAALSAVVVLAPTGDPATAGSAAPDDGEYRTRGFGDYHLADSKLAYYGRPRLMRRPCVVRSDAVYALIPEYQEIRANGIPSGKPKYHFLMREASKRFTRAVKAMARKYRHDTVAEAGAITILRPGAPPPPDRTQETIQALAR